MFLFFFFLFWLCLALAPCLSPQAAQPGQGGPDYGDRIIMGSLGEPSNLIPPLASDVPSSEVAGQLYIGLLKYDKDLKIVPWAAQSYEVLEGGLLLRFTLRPGIRWQDGVELTAEDVAFTYRMMIDPKTPTSYAGGYKTIDSFTVLSRYSFEVRYAKPYARSLETWMGAIMPRHVLEGQDLMTTPVARNPVSCGPFIFKEWVPGSRVVLEANPDYFEGRPKLDGVIYTIIPDATTMFLELRAGKVDMMGLSAQQYLYQTPPSFREQYNVFRYLSFAYTYLGYNLQSPLFRDKKVRQALAYAIDKKAVIAGARMGQGESTIGPYVPGTWAYNDKIRDYPHDLAKARALLKEAGWEKDASGVLRNKNGLPFAFTVLTNQGNEERVKTAVIIQAQLKELGIDMRVRTVEWAVFFSQFVNTGFFDAVILGWTVPQDPDVYDVWHSSRMSPSGLNFMKYSNKEVDELIEKGRATFDRALRKRCYDRIQEILHEDQPYCFLYVPYSLPAVQKRFQGLEVAPAGITWNFDQWWVPKARQRHTVAP